MNASSRNLLLSNAATLAAALVLQWDLGWLLWPYWIQSVIVGWYARCRMLALDRFSTEGFTSSGRRVAEDESGKRSTATFFALHYGCFHLAYLAFLCKVHPVADLRSAALLVAAIPWTDRAGFVASALFIVWHLWRSRGLPVTAKANA